MPRRGLSARLRLTLSYAALVVIVGAMLLAVVFVYLLRYVPEGNLVVLGPGGAEAFAPDRSDLLRAFVPAATWACVALCTLGMVGGWFLAGHVLRPLAALGDAARKAAAGSLTHRIRATGPRDEFREVADAFDSMLSRVERNVDEHRRFAANASHELRTPLATTRAILDVAAADPEVDVRQLVSQLAAANDRAVAVTEALLLIARTDAAPPALSAVDLTLVLEDAVETLAHVAEVRGVELQLDAQPAVARGNGPLLLQLAVNLVQNAVVHNLDSDGWVGARSYSTPDRAVLVVENTGRSLTRDEVTALAAPFERGGGRTRASDHAGVGLGLAIAGSIVDALDGTLRLLPRAGGGLVVTADFPVTAHGPHAGR